jgi:toxin ParE1/3/4
VKHRLARQADQDIVDILHDTLKTFGPRQVGMYAELIDRGIKLVADDPLRPASLDRSDIRAGVRSYHLELAAGRRGGAAHKLYFTMTANRDGSSEVIILRVLHERMEPKRRLLQALRDEANP